jgi:hypothetical protein
MNVENNRSTLLQDTDTRLSTDTELHIALGWLTALSVSIAAMATLA